MEIDNTATTGTAAPSDGTNNGNPPEDITMMSGTNSTNDVPEAPQVSRAKHFANCELAGVWHIALIQAPVAEENKPVLTVKKQQFKPVSLPVETFTNRGMSPAQLMDLVDAEVGFYILSLSNFLSSGKYISLY